MNHRPGFAVSLAFALFSPAIMAQAPVLQPTQVPSQPPVSATAGTSATLVLPQVSAARLPNPPLRPTVPDATRYLNSPDLLKFCTAQVAQFNNRDADMIFIGDSITQGWRDKGEAVWQQNFVPRNALDFGVGGDWTQHVLWRLDNYPIQRLHPKIAVVLIGTNNTRNTAPEIADGVKAVLTKTQAIFPGVKIILVSIMPNGRANDLMMSANTILRTFADDKTVYYLDLVPLMMPVGDNWKGLGEDKLHPDEAGYQLWADALLPLVNKLMLLPVQIAPQPASPVQP